MTNQCLTYIASSFALATTFAYPSHDSHEVTQPPKLNIWNQFDPKSTNTADHAVQTDESINANQMLNPDEINYLATITNLSQQALNNVKSTLNTISDPNNAGLPTQLPLVKPSTSVYYDPYDGEHRPKPPRKSDPIALGLGIGIPMGIIATCIVIGLIMWCRKRKRRNRNVLPIPFAKKTNDYEAQLDSPAYSMHDPWILDRNCLEINYSKKLGSGAFCNVFKGKIFGQAPVSQIHPGVRTQQLRDCPVAIKMLPSFADDIARSDFMQEINFMKSLAYHPHLVSMLGYIFDRRSPYLLVEFCEHGDLLHLIRSRKDEIIKGPSGYPNGLKIKDLLMFSWQISNGLEYLNSIGCIHRDIAARNILVDASYTCKIGDFGLCRLTDSLLYTARGGRLPLKWMAPESLSTYEYSFKSDVWSYAILLWELFSLGEVPYSNIQTTDLLEMHQSGARLKKPQYCPDEIYTVMGSGWQLNPEDRPTFQSICETLASMLENATENYGYLIPTSRRDTQMMQHNDEQCENV